MPHGGGHVGGGGGGGFHGGGFHGGGFHYHRFDHHNHHHHHHRPYGGGWWWWGGPGYYYGRPGYYAHRRAWSCACFWIWMVVALVIIAISVGASVGPSSFSSENDYSPGATRIMPSVDSTFCTRVSLSGSNPSLGATLYSLSSRPVLNGWNNFTLHEAASVPFSGYVFYQFFMRKGSTANGTSCIPTTSLVSSLQLLIIRGKSNLTLGKLVLGRPKLWTILPSVQGVLRPISLDSRPLQTTISTLCITTVLLSVEALKSIFSFIGKSTPWTNQPLLIPAHIVAYLAASLRLLEQPTCLLLMISSLRSIPVTFPQAVLQMEELLQSL